ncbi:DarT ssDNA thymidine ADP-ribosyltransferase family protein [Ursidibacter sp. B-7004-1]
MKTRKDRLSPWGDISLDQGLGTTSKNILFMPTTPEQQEINDVLRAREIKWLCHFTPRKNLKNIRENGLKLRNNLDFDAVITDHSRYDRYSNAICLSISKPNKWMFQNKKEQGFDLCLLLINPAVLYQKKCIFYPHNAATACYRNIDLEQLTGSSSLENLFTNPINYQKSGLAPQSIWRYEWLKQCETTSDQAEVQCLENIEPNYINYIIEDNIPLTYDEISNFVHNKKCEKQERENIFRKIGQIIQEQENRLRLEKIKQEEENRLRLEQIKQEEENRLRLEKIKQEEENRLRLEKTKQEQQIRLEDNKKHSYSSGDEGCVGIIILLILLSIFIL